MAHPSHPHHAQYLARSRSNPRLNTHSASTTTTITTTEERPISSNKHKARTHDRPRDPRRQRMRDAQRERDRASRERTSEIAGHFVSGLVATESHSEPSDPEGSAAAALAAALPAGPTRSNSSLGKTNDYQPKSRPTASHTLPISRQQVTPVSLGSQKQQSVPTADQRELSTSAPMLNALPAAHSQFAPSPAPHRAARGRAGTAPGRVSDSTLDKQELYSANTYFIPRTSSTVPTGRFGSLGTERAPSASSLASPPSTSTRIGLASSCPSGGPHASTTGLGGKSKGQEGEIKGSTQPPGASSSVQLDLLPAPTKHSKSFLGRLATSWKQRGRTSQRDVHASAPSISAAEQLPTPDAPAAPPGLTMHSSHPLRPRGGSLASNSILEPCTIGSSRVLADAPSDEMEHMADDVSPTTPGPLTPSDFHPLTFGRSKVKGPSSPRIRVRTRELSRYLMPSSSTLHESGSGIGEDEDYLTSTTPNITRESSDTKLPSHQPQSSAPQQKRPSTLGTFPYQLHGAPEPNTGKRPQIPPPLKLPGGRRTSHLALLPSQASGLSIASPITSPLASPREEEVNPPFLERETIYKSLSPDLTREDTFPPFMVLPGVPLPPSLLDFAGEQVGARRQSWGTVREKSSSLHGRHGSLSSPRALGSLWGSHGAQGKGKSTGHSRGLSLGAFPPSSSNPVAELAGADVWGRIVRTNSPEPQPTASFNTSVYSSTTPPQPAHPAPASTQVTDQDELWESLPSSHPASTTQEAGGSTGQTSINPSQSSSSLFSLDPSLIGVTRDAGRDIHAFQAMLRGFDQADRAVRAHVVAQHTSAPTTPL